MYKYKYKYKLQHSAAADLLSVKMGRKEERKEGRGRKERNSVCMEWMKERLEKRQKNEGIDGVQKVGVAVWGLEARDWALGGGRRCRNHVRTVLASSPGRSLGRAVGSVRFGRRPARFQS